MDAFGINSKAEDSQTLVVLREFPHVIALEERCRILQKLIAEDKGQISFPDTHVKIRRSHIIPDGFAKLGVYREQLKGNVKVRAQCDGPLSFCDATLLHSAMRLSCIPRCDTLAFRDATLLHSAM